MTADSIRLGRIAGVPLAVNWSVLVIVWLLTWGLAETVLPEAAPGHAGATYWLAGFAGAIVFFCSLLAHELAHAVLARRAGMQVEGMTLWLFGGVAKLGGKPPDARADLRIAAVGPATSLGLSLGFGALGVWSAVAGMPDLVLTLIAWLAAINLILAVFNLIPGAPLDGGRILRALLWRHHGDWVRAAVSATRAGQVLGYVLIWLGLLQFLLGAGIGGLWMVFIGWFVLFASRAEREYIVTDAALEGVRVGDIMTPHPRTAPGWITVDDLIEHHLLGHPHSAYPVEGLHGQVDGLVTLGQLRAVRPADRDRTRVVHVALPLDRVPKASPDRPLLALLEEIGNEAGGRILVFDQGQLVGLVTPSDVAQAVDVRSLGGRFPARTRAA